MSHPEGQLEDGWSKRRCPRTSLDLSVSVKQVLQVWRTVTPKEISRSEEWQLWSPWTHLTWARGTLLSGWEALHRGLGEKDRILGKWLLDSVQHLAFKVMTVLFHLSALLRKLLLYWICHWSNIIAPFQYFKKNSSTSCLFWGWKEYYCQ